VEGDSDKAAMEALLRPLIERRLEDGIAITFTPTPSTVDRKLSVLHKVPKRAINILRNDLSAHVVAMPDLYPTRRGFTEGTVEELVRGIKANFIQELRNHGVDDPRVEGRFHVHCFKHDLEVLVLAAEEALQSRLGVARLRRTWCVPVEDQNHDTPPKKVIKELFAEHEEYYHETIDTPLILGDADYSVIAERCPQCFKPFVEFLESLEAPQGL
jgi:hypothetical protein